MGDCARFGARRWAAWAGAAFFCIAAIFSLPFKASAQNTAIISRGDAAVTAFSGARQSGEVPPGRQPLDVTFIDVNGAVLQVFDLTQLGGGAGGTGCKRADQVQTQRPARSARFSASASAQLRIPQATAEHLSWRDLRSSALQIVLPDSGRRAAARSG